MNAPIVGIVACAVVLAFGCAKPNQYVPHDDAAEEEPADAELAPDVRQQPRDGAAEPDAPTTGDAPLSSPDARGTSSDVAPPPPDGPCGSPTDPHNCGTCDHDCTKLNNIGDPAKVTCAAGTCVVPPAACSSDRAHCSARPDDGCEANLGSAETCGQCGTRCNTGELCSASGGTYRCVSSCMGTTPDKCPGSCTNLQNDVHNCGTCGHDCTQLANVKSSSGITCQTGHCSIPAASCTTGYGHCGGGAADNGCETNISTPATCGCSSCAAGESCTASGGSYKCGCGGNKPDKCGNTCVDLQSDGENCGKCGHSCLGGPCTTGQCQPVQIYAGGDDTYSYAFDATYLYFVREKSQNLRVISRISKADGSGFTDIWATDIGDYQSTLVLVNGTLYWATPNDIVGCPTPTCSGGPQVKVANQVGVSRVFSDVAGTQLFWVAHDPNDTNKQNLMKLGSPSPIATTADYFGDGTADASYVYLSEGTQLVRVPVGGGAKTPFGSSNSPSYPALNSSRIAFLVNPPAEIGNQGTEPAIEAVQRSTLGSQQRVGTYGTLYEVWGGLVIDEQYAYWSVNCELKGTSDNTLFLFRCPLTGCGTNPTILAQNAWAGGNLKADATALYSTGGGIYKIAK